MEAETPFTVNTSWWNNVLGQVYSYLRLVPQVMYNSGHDKGAKTYCGASTAAHCNMQYAPSDAKQIRLRPMVTDVN